MLSKFLTVLMVLLFAFAPMTRFALGQESASEPIYLDEPEPEPPARKGRRQTVEDKFEDDTVRLKVQVVKLSNDRVVYDGELVEYYPDGKKYRAGTYNMGVFDGDWQYWFPNGQLCKKITYKLGKPEGQWDVFNEKGELTSKQSYKAGKREGKWINYYVGTEQPLVEMTYSAGKPVGDNISYYENGNKRRSVLFKDGVIHGTLIEWDENGKKIAELPIDKGKRGTIVRFD